jgi:REP element-mobilizing transposase RayT
VAFTPYNPDETVRRHRLNLPHWRQWDRTYFITTRLADSIPADIRESWLQQRNAWLTQRGIVPGGDLAGVSEDVRREFHQKFTARFHELLDGGHGECLLARADLAEEFSQIMISSHGESCHLDAWVIMPNHLHALVEPMEGVTLGAILKSWKGASARKINGMLGRSGRCWQPETYDHIVRSEAQLEHFRRYIAGNPSKAGLKDGFVLGVGERIGISLGEDFGWEE